MVWLFFSLSLSFFLFSFLFSFFSHPNRWELEEGTKKRATVLVARTGEKTPKALLLPEIPAPAEKKRFRHSQKAVIYTRSPFKVPLGCHDDDLKDNRKKKKKTGWRNPNFPFLIDFFFSFSPNTRKRSKRRRRRERRQNTYYRRQSPFFVCASVMLCNSRTLLIRVPADSLRRLVW